MAKAKKLPSGNWRILAYSHTDITGKRVYESFTAPTKAEVEYMAAEFVKGKQSIDFQKKRSREEMTVRECGIKFLHDMEGILSPTTLQGYEKDLNNSFVTIMDTRVKDLDDDAMQEAILAEMKRTTRNGNTVSSKTLRNEYGTISRVIKHCTKKSFVVSLPEVEEKFVDVPSASEVIPLIVGTEIELPCMIAMWLSFSISEVRGIKCSSIRNGKIFVDQVVVVVKGQAIEKKLAKKKSRKRSAAIPNYIMKLIENQENYKKYIETGEDSFLIQLSTKQITGRFTRLMKKNGYNISFHKLRHINASVMAYLRIPDKYAQERGGWSTPHVMKKVYQHTFSDARIEVDNTIDDYFESLL